jgi:hypothetical protein
MATKKKTAKKAPSKKEASVKSKLDLHEAKFGEASASAGLQPASFDSMSLSPEMANTLINSDVKKPSWKSNKYPVSPDQFKKMQAMAAVPDKMGTRAFAATDSSAPDTDGESNLAMSAFDQPELDPSSQAPSMLAPGVTSGFEAIPATGWVPPDCVVASGLNEVVACVNSEFRIYSKSGTMLRRNQYGPFFSAVLPNSAGVKIFDPRIIWDHYNNRYVMIVAATQNSPQKSWCGIAVTKTADPMGAWWVWALDASLNGGTATTNWMDYPMLGFDPQAVYIGMSMFNGNNFQYAKVRILNKTELYAGAGLRWYDFWNLKNADGSNSFTVQPCCHYRGAGAGPAYLINNYFGTNNKMTLWTITNPLALWGGSAPTLSKTTVNCRDYGVPPPAKQKGSATAINTNDNRLLNAVYQHTGNIKRIWTAHNTKATWAGDTEARCAVQWYEVDVPTSAVIQSNFYGQSGSYYFFPAIQTDLNRNAFMVFGRCNVNEFANLRMTGRRVTAAAGDMENSVLVKEGESAHLSGRYGDYFGIGRDGADGNSIVAIGEYAESGNNWGTWVVRTKF